MTDHPLPVSVLKVSENNLLKIGGEDLLELLLNAYSRTCKTTDKNSYHIWSKILADIRIRIGAFLNTGNVSFSLGAGASVESGGMTIGAVPRRAETKFHESGGSRDVRLYIRRWLPLFCQAAQSGSGSDHMPNGPRATVSLSDSNNAATSDFEERGSAG